MKTQEEHNQIREELMLGAINTVSKYGLEGLTTKQISLETNYNEAYIYRYFLDKDDLLDKTFLYVDKRIFALLKGTFSVIEEGTDNLREACKKYFDLCWDHVVTKPERSIFYVRYYNSTLFTKYVQEDHAKIIEEFADICKKYVIDGVDNKIVLHGIYNSILSYAMDVAIGKCENTKENNDEIFNFIFNIINLYFKK